MKRIREDGHLSKEELEAESNRGGGGGGGGVDFFSRAGPEALALRRKAATSQRVDKKEEFARHIETLNVSFYDWFKEQVGKDGAADLQAGAQDYVDHVCQIEDRYLRSYGEVLTFGSGDCGQLAHGTEEDDDLMVRFPRIVISLRNKHVVGIACGGLHNAVYTQEGQVYTWGCADDGSLGRDGEEAIPMLVQGGLAGEVIISVACGDCQTMAVSTKGQVWGWGCYKDREGKQWFNPSSKEVAPNPVKDIKKKQTSPLLIQGFAESAHVVEVACGSAVNLARCSDGSLYSWGMGECGELGRIVPPLKNGEEYDKQVILEHYLTPGGMFDAQQRRVQDVKTIGCGAYHSLVVAPGGQVLACGLNNYGQLGLGESGEGKLLLHVVPLLTGAGVVSVKGGMHHSLVLTSAGQMLAFGRGDSGQMGLPGMVESEAGEAGACCTKPIRPSVPEHAVFSSIACGGNHNLALTRENEVYSWGYGDMLALGHGEERDEPLPKKLNFSAAIGVKTIRVTQVEGGGQVKTTHTHKITLNCKQETTPTPSSPPSHTLHSLFIQMPTPTPISTRPLWASLRQLERFLTRS